MEARWVSWRGHVLCSSGGEESPVQKSSGRDLAEEVEVRGHILDAQLLPKVMNRIKNMGGTCEILDYRIGYSPDDPSYARLAVSAESEIILDEILGDLIEHGVSLVQPEHASFINLSLHHGCDKSGSMSGRSEYDSITPTSPGLKDGLEVEGIPSLDRPGPSIERPASVLSQHIDRTTQHILEAANLIAANPSVAEDLLAAVAALVGAVSKSPCVMNRQEAAEELGLSVDRLKTLTSEGRLGVLVGAQNLYGRKQVQSFKQLERPRGRPKSRP